MIQVNIKPMSVNEAWKGERYKTDKYKKYTRDVLFLLPKIELPPPPYRLTLEFGFSNSLCDFDNPVKPFVDILQKKYQFNDRDIHEATIKKVKCKTGSEFIRWKMETL